MKAFIDVHKCSRCKKCFAVEVCPTKAIFKTDPEGPAIIEPNYCYGCMDCIEKCPAKAISILEL